MKIVLLAAGVGKRFGKRTQKLPKCLIPLGKNGYHLLSRYLHSFSVLGIRDVLIVVGHEKEKIKKACAKKSKGLRIRFVHNPSYRKGSIYSLYKASRYFDESLVIMDADVYFPTIALKKLIDSKKQTAFLLDKRSKSSGEEMMLMAKSGRPVHIAKKVDRSLKVLGEATGIFKVGKTDAKKLSKILSRMVRAGKVFGEYEESYCELMKTSAVGSETIEGFWTEMDFEEDRAKILRHEKSLTKP